MPLQYLGALPAGETPTDLLAKQKQTQLMQLQSELIQKQLANSDMQTAIARDKAQTDHDSAQVSLALQRAKAPIAVAQAQGGVKRQTAEIAATEAGTAGTEAGTQYTNTRNTGEVAAQAIAQKFAEKQAQANLDLATAQKNNLDLVYQESQHKLAQGQQEELAKYTAMFFQSAKGTTDLGNPRELQLQTYQKWAFDKTDPNHALGEKLVLLLTPYIDAPVVSVDKPMKDILINAQAQTYIDAKAASDADPKNQELYDKAYRSYLDLVAVVDSKDLEKTVDITVIQKNDIGVETNKTITPMRVRDIVTPRSQNTLLPDIKPRGAAKASAQAQSSAQAPSVTYTQDQLLNDLRSGQLPQEALTKFKLANPGVNTDDPKLHAQINAAISAAGAKGIVK
jgi:hypothetical protein